VCASAACALPSAACTDANRATKHVLPTAIEVMERLKKDTGFVRDATSDPS